MLEEAGLRTEVEPMLGKKGLLRFPAAAVALGQAARRARAST